ncbi:hypothetical protein TIFTF001_008283 [Ficus carica]|uniref:Uncharacterized protein n=1 Tax=Ficus carica TaxID=3494 RepID=A0AA87ZT23_FICCA|nr:hypothetical protein TIFTF001_008283 [Ficus carica]
MTSPECPDLSMSRSSKLKFQRTQQKLVILTPAIATRRRSHRKLVIPTPAITIRRRLRQNLAIPSLFTVSVVNKREYEYSPSSVYSSQPCCGHETPNRSILSLSPPASAAPITSRSFDLSCSRSVNSELLRSTFPLPRLRPSEGPPNIPRPSSSPPSPPPPWASPLPKPLPFPSVTLHPRARIFLTRRSLPPQSPP